MMDRALLCVQLFQEKQIQESSGGGGGGGGLKCLWVPRIGAKMKGSKMNENNARSSEWQKDENVVHIGQFVIGLIRAPVAVASC